MSTNKPDPTPVSSTNGWGKLGSIIVAVFMLFLLSKAGVPAGFLKRLLPFAVQRAMADQCAECDGDGVVDANCQRCLGRGYIEGANCTQCNHTGKVERACRFCAGSGKKPKP